MVTPFFGYHLIQVNDSPPVLLGLPLIQVNSLYFPRVNWDDFVPILKEEGMQNE